MMFEIGREYLFVTGASEMPWVGEVVEVSMPIIRVRSSVMEQGEVILNASSLTFHSATLQPVVSDEKARDKPALPPWIESESGTDPLADIIEP